jgi:hypothetical protein
MASFYSSDTLRARISSVLRDIDLTLSPLAEIMGHRGSMSRETGGGAAI